MVINNFDYYQAISNRQKETPQEREMRELRQLSMLTRKYPDQANLQVTESITVDSQTGEVLQHKQQLKQPVRAYPKSAQGVKRDKGRTRRPSGVPKPQEL